MADRIRSLDWAATPLGPIAGWPQTLRTPIDLLLGAKEPTYIGWGPGLTSIYNDGFISIVGGRHPGLGRGFAELWPEIWEEFRPLVGAAMAGEAQHFVDRPVALSGPDKPTSWFTFSFTPLRDETSSIAGVYCTATETTEKVLAEASLRRAKDHALLASEERYRSLFNSIDQGFCVLEVILDETNRPIDYRYIEINPVFEQQSGMSNALGRTIRELVPNIEPFWFEVYGAVALTGEPKRFEDHSASMSRWFDVYAFRVGDPAQRHVAVLFSDISARKQVEIELRTSEERFRLMADAVPQIVWITDAHGRLEFFNRQWTAYTGQAYEPTTAAMVVAKAVHPDDAAMTFNRFKQARRSESNLTVEHRVRSTSGEYRWFLVRAEPYRDPRTGHVIKWFGISMDIHDRKLAEDALAEADRHKDEFLAMLAHELRNPLAPISTASQLLCLAAADEQRVRQMGAIISRQVTHLTSLVDDLLDVSRVTRGLVTLEREVLDVQSVLSSAVEQARPFIEERRQSLTIDDSSALVDADRARLTQVIVNLLSNASKYTHAGGKIHLRTEVDKTGVCIEVSDNGIGIDAQLLPRVFDLFTQAARAPDRSYGGLGLGLALVRNLVQLHGGQVEGRSAGLGQGSTFTIWLPLALQDDVAAAPAHAEPAPLHEATPRHVMVVDDNSDAVDTLADLLVAHGHRVTVARDGFAALELASKGTPEVFILDIGLPGMDGYELARRLRAEPAFAGATFIALTGYGQPDDLAQSQAAGFDHHFVKPIDAMQLAQLLLLPAPAQPDPVNPCPGRIREQ